jgi:hypothetical protein
MPAPTVDTIFRFEDAVTAAIVAAFNADATLGDNAFGPRELTGLPKNRIDVVSSGFAKASDAQVFAQARWWDQHYSGEVEIAVLTQRGAVAAASHATRVGRVRFLMSPKAQILTSSNLPYYEVLQIEQTGASFTPAADTTDADRTDLTFTVHLGILPSAFPA